MREQETIFDRLAKDRNITAKEMKEIMSERIKAGLQDSDPEKRAQWEKIPHEGEFPTPEEWVRYVVEKLEKENCEDQLIL